MSSWIECDKGHLSRVLCREAAIEIAERKSLGPCARPGCGAQRRYYVGQKYANTHEEHEYELVRVVRLKSSAEAEEEGYDPMLFVLRSLKSKATTVWPFYWGHNKAKRWHVGQFPPMLTKREWKKLFARMN